MFTGGLVGPLISQSERAYYRSRIIKDNKALWWGALIYTSLLPSALLYMNIMYNLHLCSCLCLALLFYSVLCLLSFRWNVMMWIRQKKKMMMMKRSFIWKSNLKGRDGRKNKKSRNRLPLVTRPPNRQLQNPAHGQAHQVSFISNRSESLICVTCK